MNEHCPRHIRWLPQSEIVYNEAEDWMPASFSQYSPGWIDTRAYPELRDLTVPADSPLAPRYAR